MAGPRPGIRRFASGRLQAARLGPALEGSRQLPTTLLAGTEVTLQDGQWDGWRDEPYF